MLHGNDIVAIGEYGMDYLAIIAKPTAKAVIAKVNLPKKHHGVVLRYKVCYR